MRMKLSIFSIFFATSSAAELAKCTLSGHADEQGCLDQTDGTEHCAWCVLHEIDVVKDKTPSSGFCVSELQAKEMENSIPIIECNRYPFDKTVDAVANDDDIAVGGDALHSDDQVPPDDDQGPPSDDQVSPDDDQAPPSDDEVQPDDDQAPPSDDQAPPSDDQAPPSDDQAPPDDDQAPPSDDQAPSDDKVAPSDDAVPDDFWTCLLKKDSKVCSAANCTWCDTKAGFGVCMTGAAAESASHSDWFSCQAQNESLISASYLLPAYNTIRAAHKDPYDSSCVMAFVKDQTEAGCVSTADKNGQPCEWCNIAGMANVCLTTDQAAMGASLGISCDDQKILDPYDSSCALAFLQDQTKDGCLATEDEDGNSCEYCSLQDSINICLTQEQATLVEQLGMDCADSSVSSVDFNVDPLFDNACAIGYINTLSKDGCVSTFDSEGHSCEYCPLRASFSLCLNAKQAEAAEKVGITCDTDSSLMVNDPYDTSCLLAYLQDQSEDACVAATDSDGNACEFCSLQGAFSLCLTPEQAALSEQFGVSCDSVSRLAVEDPYDPSCVLSFLQDQSKEGCVAATDSDGNACEFCSIQGAFDICLNTDQAGFASQFGVTCDDASRFMAVDPYDTSCVLAYLQDQSEDGCVAATDSDGNACEFCSLQGAFSLCLTPEQAEISEQFGITCDSDSSLTAEDPYDTSCLLAYLQDQSKDGCVAATDSDGNSCEFCSVQGAFSLCLTQEQAGLSEEFGVTCDKADDGNVSLPPDFFSCLQNYEEDGCQAASCTWCNTEVGISFCLAPAAADATKECKFFDCEFYAGLIEDPSSPFTNVA